MNSFLQKTTNLLPLGAPPESIVCDAHPSLVPNPVTPKKILVCALDVQDDV